MTTPPPYSDHDAAIWHTRAILRHLREGRPHALPQVATAFPPQLGPDERVLAVGRFELLTFRAVGDGSYQHDGGFFFATGLGGLAATAAVAGVRAAGNSRRRGAAAADAVPRWVVDDAGVLFVSTHGFYLDTGRAFLPWAWPHVDTMQLVAPRAVHLQGRSTDGPVSWILQADWAELVFVLWCLVRHPAHPQLTSGQWVPAGWDARDARRLEIERRQIDAPDAGPES